MEDAKFSQQSAWMEEVAARRGSMTQRARSTVDKWVGGIELLIAEAKRAGVHLAEITDDHGSQLVIASAYPITVLA